MRTSVLTKEYVKYSFSYIYIKGGCHPNRLEENVRNDNLKLYTQFRLEENVESV